MKNGLPVEIEAELRAGLAWRMLEASLPCPALIGKRQSGGGFWQLFSFLSHNVTNNILNPSLILVGVIATVLPLFSFSLILGYIGLATDSFFSSKTQLKLSPQCDGIGGNL